MLVMIYSLVRGSVSVIGLALLAIGILAEVIVFLW